MTNQHPITPSLELVQQWSVASQLLHSDESWEYELFIVQRAAQWGADKQLDRCTAWLCEYYQNDGSAAAEMMRSDCRPKPLSLKEQALAALHAVTTGANDIREQHQDLDTILRALEALPND